MNEYCVLNYPSKLGVDGSYGYEFWFTGSIIRIIADKPFSRRDIARIDEVKKQSSTEWRIYITVIGDPNLEKIPDEVFDKGEVPTLLFATTKVYKNENSDYQAYGTDNIKVILHCSSVKDHNKSYTIAFLVKGKQAKLQSIDTITGAMDEWLISSVN